MELVAQVSKDKVKLTLDEDDLFPKEEEYDEEEAGRQSIGFTNVTNWIIGHLNALKMKVQAK